MSDVIGEEVSLPIGQTFDTLEDYMNSNLVEYPPRLGKLISVVDSNNSKVYVFVGDGVQWTSVGSIDSTDETINVSGVPNIQGNDGKLLSNDGSKLVWIANTSSFPSVAGQASKVLSTDGNSILWTAQSGGTTYTAGTAVNITGSTISVDIGPGSNQAATGNHSHSGYAAAGHEHLITDINISGTTNIVASPQGTTQFLRSDGTWAVPSGVGGGVGLSDTNTWTGAQKFQNSAGVVVERSATDNKLKFDPGTGTDDFTATFTLAQNLSLNRTYSFPDESGHIPLLSGAAGSTGYYLKSLTGYIGLYDDVYKGTIITVPPSSAALSSVNGGIYVFGSSSQTTFNLSSVSSPGTNFMLVNSRTSGNITLNWTGAHLQINGNALPTSLPIEKYMSCIYVATNKWIVTGDYT